MAILNPKTSKWTGNENYARCEMPEIQTMVTYKRTSEQDYEYTLWVENKIVVRKTEVINPQLLKDAISASS